MAVQMNDGKELMEWKRCTMGAGERKGNYLIRRGRAAAERAQLMSTVVHSTAGWRCNRGCGKYRKILSIVGTGNTTKLSGQSAVTVVLVWCSGGPGLSAVFPYHQHLLAAVTLCTVSRQEDSVTGSESQYAGARDNSHRQKEVRF